MQCLATDSEYNAVWQPHAHTCWAYLLLGPRTTSPWMAALVMNRFPPLSIANWENALQACLQPHLMEGFSQLRIPSLRFLSLLQSWQKSSQHSHRDLLPAHMKPSIYIGFYTYLFKASQWGRSFLRLNISIMYVFRIYILIAYILHWSILGQSDTPGKREPWLKNFLC